MSKQIEKGFITLVPIIIMSVFLTLLAYITHERIGNFQYGVLQHELFLDHYYDQLSCQNKGILYQSYDPLFTIKC